MKKTILGLAFLTIFGTSFSSFAQSQSTEGAKKECVNKDCKKNKECKDKKDCKDKKECCKGKKDGRNKQGLKKGGTQAALFEGIVLTDNQKGQIQALNEGMRLSRQEMMKSMKERKESATKDSKPSAESAAKMRNAKHDLRAKYLKDMSEILNSDQYVTFLQNYYINTPQHRAMAHGPKAMKNGKGMKGGKDMKGFKGQRGPKPSAGMTQQNS